MYFEKLARSLRLPALAMCSAFLFACDDGDGPDSVEDPLFANCPGPDCVLNPVPPGPGPAVRNLLANGSFEGGSFLPWINAGSIIVDPSPDSGNNIYSVPVAVAGNSFDVNLSQALALTDGDSYTLNFRARASVDRSMIVGIGLYGGSFAGDTRTVQLSGAEWLGFSFDLTAPACTGVPAGCRVLFDMGAEVGTVYIDDVSVTPAADTSMELVTDGSFTTGGFVAQWVTGAPPGINPPPGSVGLEGSFVADLVPNTNVYNVNVIAAGAPFNVNLSQIFTITPGVTYKLTFRARTDAPNARTMLAGLGLNEPPFTSETRTVLSLGSGDWRSYTYTFTPGFGNSNSRVLFDMGAAEGQVYIDDVSVVVE